MKKASLIGLAVILIIVLVGFSCLGRKESTGKETTANAAVKKMDSLPKAEVSVAAVQQGPIFKAYTAMGTLVSRESARLMPKVMGRIARINVSEGDHVAAGQVLMQISPSDYQWAHQNASALEHAAGVALEKSRRDFERAESLHKESAIADQMYQDARSAYEAAKWQYQQASAGEASARKSLQECNVTAPISGVVTFKFGNEGELTGPQSPYPVFIIEQMGSVKLEVDLPEDAFGNLTTGNKSMLTVDAIPNQTFEGTITKIYPTINPLSRTFKVSIALENPEMRLRSGMTARAKVIQQARTDALYAPKAAFLPGEDGYYVYKLTGNTVRKTPVKVGIEGDDTMEVTSGLAVGDQVVILGQTGLRDGMAVKVTLPEKVAPAAAPIPARASQQAGAKSVVPPAPSKG